MSKSESGIVNLGERSWIAYAKRDNHVIYFDSFGNLQSLKELVQYWKWCNKDRVQLNTIKSTIRASVDNCVCSFSEWSVYANLKTVMCY